MLEYLLLLIIELRKASKLLYTYPENWYLRYNVLE